jgi:hypothetical protein
MTYRADKFAGESEPRFLSVGVQPAEQAHTPLPPICAATRSPAWLPVLRKNVVICMRSRA